MSKIGLFFIFLSLFSLNLLAQEKFDTSKFSVNLSDLKMKMYAKDSTARAIVIYDFGNSYVDPNTYNLVTKEKHKIKILTKEGFDKASVSIYLYQNGSNKEAVEDIVATTYNLSNNNVTTTKLSKENIYNEHYNKNYSVVKFTLPNVQEGCVINYSYTLKSPFMFKYKDWEFQSDIPKIYSEYRTSIPANWDYNIKLIGGKKLSVQERNIKKSCLIDNAGASADCTLAHYVMENVPAFIEEDFMTNKVNYLSKIDYELKSFTNFRGVVNAYTKSWKTVDNELKVESNIGRQLKKNINLKDYLSASVLEIKDPLKKAKAIYNHVQNTYTWNGKYKIFTQGDVNKLLDNKSGNVSSINMLLHNMLNKANIKAKAVLLSTRNNGFATKIYPVLSDFNYVIVQATINNKTYLLDATGNYLIFGEIPFRCLNSYGRLLDFKNGSSWVDIKPSTKSSILYSVDLSINKENNLTGTVNKRTTGYHALNSRKAYFPNSKKYTTALQKDIPDISLSNYTIKNTTPESSSFSEAFTIQYNAENIGETVYVNPFVFSFFKENPFKLQERTYPIDFGYKDNYLYILKINLGDNYKVLELPKNIRIELPNKTGSLSCAVQTVGNTINLLFKLEFSQAKYAPEYYPSLKKFMSQVVNTQTNSLIVLQKK